MQFDHRIADPEDARYMSDVERKADKEQHGNPPNDLALTALYLKRATAAGVPEHLIDGLVLYIVRGVQPGSFLCAVLSNDLSESLGRADLESRAGLFRLVSFLYNDAPGTCWGSPAKLHAWANVGGLYGVQS